MEIVRVRGIILLKNKMKLESNPESEVKNEQF